MILGRLGALAGSAPSKFTKLSGQRLVEIKSLLKKCFEGESLLKKCFEGDSLFKKCFEGKACLRNLSGGPWPPLLPKRTPPVILYHPLRGAYTPPPDGPKRRQERPQESSKSLPGATLPPLGAGLGPRRPPEAKKAQGKNSTRENS